MKKSGTHHSLTWVYIVSFVFLCGLFYAGTSHANVNPAPGTQLAYFVGTHYNGAYRGGYNYRHYPQYRHYNRYYYNGAYRNPWGYIGNNCRKTCWVDRWSGRTIRCYRTC